MKEDRQLDLLTELLRLQRKYGKEQLSQLATALRDPTFLSHITSLAEALSQDILLKASLTSARKRKPTTAETLDRIVGEIPVKDDGRWQLLRDICAALTEERKAKTKQEVLRLAADNGLQIGNPKTRAEAVISLIRELRLSPIEDVQRVAEDIQKRLADGDGSLQGWSKIILKKRTEP